MKKLSNEELKQLISKRAYTEINSFNKCTNMLDVELIMNNILSLIFKTKNFGLLKIKMRKEGKEDEFEKIKNLRLENEKNNKENAKKIIFQMIPERFHKSTMYKKLEEKIRYN